jgi:hypothetical protein
MPSKPRLMVQNLGKRNDGKLTSTWDQGEYDSCTQKNLDLTNVQYSSVGQQEIEEVLRQRTTNMLSYRQT